MLVWLPAQGFKHSDSVSKNVAYIPSKATDNDPLFCYCGILKENSTAAKCSFYSDPIMRQIEQSCCKWKNWSRVKTLESILTQAFLFRRDILPRLVIKKLLKFICNKQQRMFKVNLYLIKRF